MGNMINKFMLITQLNFFLLFMMMNSRLIKLLIHSPASPLANCLIHRNSSLIRQQELHSTPTRSHWITSLSTPKWAEICLSSTRIMRTIRRWKANLPFVRGHSEIDEASSVHRETSSSMAAAEQKISVVCTDLRRMRANRYGFFASIFLPSPPRERKKAIFKA